MANRAPACTCAAMCTPARYRSASRSAPTKVRRPHNEAVRRAEPLRRCRLSEAAERKVLPLRETFTLLRSCDIPVAVRGCVGIDGEASRAGVPSCRSDRSGLLAMNEARLQTSDARDPPANLALPCFAIHILRYRRTSNVRVERPRAGDQGDPRRHAKRMPTPLP